MKKNEITIVTAFFDIGRTNFKELPRSNDKYLEYFKFWARMKNKLVVYTDSVMAQKVKEVRDSFGLGNKTKIIEINDISVIEPKLLDEMKKVENDSCFYNYRYSQNVPENKALYNYVMLLKSWCINDAVEKKYADGMIAWIDFGFNHGGNKYIEPLEFDFEWKYSFDEKITYFYNDEYRDIPVFKLVQSMEVNIMGCMFLLPSSLAHKFWELMKNSMQSLLDVGFMDDDQLVMLMAYKKAPELFRLIKSDWFLPLKQFGGEHLTVKEDEKIHKSLKTKLLTKYRKQKRNRIYIKRLKTIFLKEI